MCGLSVLSTTRKLWLCQLVCIYITTARSEKREDSISALVWKSEDSEGFLKDWEREKSKIAVVESSKCSFMQQRAGVN